MNSFLICATHHKKYSFLLNEQIVRGMQHENEMLGAKHEKNRDAVRPSHKQEGTNEIGLKEVGSECVEWIHLASDRVCGRSVHI